MLSLATPWWLLALPLPWLLWQIGNRSFPSHQDTAAIVHPQTTLLLEISHAEQKARKPWLWIIGCALLLLALARPQWWDTDNHQGRNFMLALDVSSSMKAQDFQINGQPLSRLDMVKRVVDSFINQRQKDRIGLIVFADDAFTLAPMTTDLKLVKGFLGDIENGMAGQKTALGEAIALGVKRLQQQNSRSRILILLTDGSNTAGEIHPLNALAMAQQTNVRIYTIGIGSQNKVLFPRGPVARPELKAVPMDEALLQHLAQTTGGVFYHASKPEELAQIIDDIEQLETVSLENDLPQAMEWYSLPLVIGLICLTLAYWQRERKVLP